VTSNEDPGYAPNTGGFTYQFAPMEFWAALHAEPDPADAASFLAMNSQFAFITTADLSAGLDTYDGGVELSIVKDSLIQAIASNFGVTIQPDKAHVAGFVTDDNGDNLPGAEVSIATADTVYYLDQDGSPASSTQCVEGPQFLIFNVEPAVYTTLSATGPVPIDVAFIPLREGSGDFECSVLVSGLVRNVGNSDLGEGGVSVEGVLSDGNVINSTVTSSTAPTGSFQFSVPGGTDIFFRTSAPGFVPVNTELMQFFADSSVGLITIPEALATQAANALSSKSEPSWNSTLQADAWFVMDVMDDLGADLPGVVFTDVDPGGATVLYNDGADNYSPTPGTVAPNTGNLPMAGGFLIGLTSLENHTFRAESTTAGSQDKVFPLEPGTITFDEFLLFPD
jgi:hypothetical protein